MIQNNISNNSNINDLINELSADKLSNDLDLSNKTLTLPINSVNTNNISDKAIINSKIDISEINNELTITNDSINIRPLTITNLNGDGQTSINLINNDNKSLIFGIGNNNGDEIIKNVQSESSYIVSDYDLNIVANNTTIDKLTVGISLTIPDDSIITDNIKDSNITMDKLTTELDFTGKTISNITLPDDTIITDNIISLDSDKLNINDDISMNGNNIVSNGTISFKINDKDMMDITEDEIIMHQKKTFKSDVFTQGNFYLDGNKLFLKLNDANKYITYDTNKILIKSDDKISLDAPNIDFNNRIYTPGLTVNNGSTSVIAGIKGRVRIDNLSGNDTSAVLELKPSSGNTSFIYANPSDNILMNSSNGEYELWKINTSNTLYIRNDDGSQRFGGYLRSHISNDERLSIGVMNGTLDGLKLETQAMMIKNNGDVGFGKIPTDKLDVNGYLSVFDSTKIPFHNETGDKIVSKITLGDRYGPQIRTVYPNNSYSDFQEFRVYNAGINATTDSQTPRLRIVRNGNAIFSNNVSASSYTTTSDERIKEDIKDLTNEEAINIINELKPKKYKYKYHDKGKDTYGFIAQDYKEVLPSSVYINDREFNYYNEETEENETIKIEGLHTIKKDVMFALLVKNLQNLNKRIEQLENEMKSIEFVD